MSNSARNVMDILTQNMWMRNLGTTASLGPENKQRYPERVKTVTKKLQHLDIPTLLATSKDTKTSSGSGSGSGTNAEEAKTTTDIGKACDGIVELANERIHESMVQVAKKNLFA